MLCARHAHLNAQDYQVGLERPACILLGGYRSRPREVDLGLMDPDHTDECQHWLDWSVAYSVPDDEAEAKTSSPTAQLAQGTSRFTFRTPPLGFSDRLPPATTCGYEDGLVY